MIVDPGSFRHRPGKPSNWNVTPERLEIYAWLGAIGLMWVAVLTPIAAILMGAP